MIETINPADVILIFDNGHGTRQYTKGKHSPDFTLFEGEWAREIVRKLSDAMTDLGFDCRIIVPEDQDISLSERCRRANKIVKDNPKKKCYYISVHINAAGGDGKWHDATGLSIYVSKKSSDTSKKLAQTLYQAGVEFGLKGNRSVPKERYWQANFTVITNTVCPAVLTENLFQDNKKECEFLKTDEGKDTIVNYHVLGLCRFFGLPASHIIEDKDKIYLAEKH